MIRVATVALIAWIAMCVPVFAQSSGLMTFEEAKQRADSGDAFAQAVVALHYQLGWNTEKNAELAAKYALASANAGEPLGQFRLGALMRAGEGVAKDEEQGLAYQATSFDGLNRAKDPYSITALGILIFQGKAIAQTIPKEDRLKEAVRLYQLAADMGYAAAQFNYAMAAKTEKNIDYYHYTQNLPLAIGQEYPPALREIGIFPGLLYVPDGVVGEHLQQSVVPPAGVGDRLAGNGNVVASLKADEATASSVTPIVQKAVLPDWVSFSTDRKTLAVLSGAAVFIYEADTGRLIKTFTMDPTPAAEETDATGGWRQPQKLFFCRGDRSLLVSYANLGTGSESPGDVAVVVDLDGAVISEPSRFAGSIVGYDAAANRLAVVKNESSGLGRGGRSDSRMTLLEVDLESREVVSQVILPQEENAAIDMEGYSAFFKNGEVAALAHWDSYEGREYGLRRFLLVDQPSASSYGGPAAEQKLVDFLSGGHAADSHGDDEAFNLGLSAARCSDFGVLVGQKPFLKWCIFESAGSQTRGLSDVGTLAIDGISAAADGARLLAWGIRFKDKYFGPDGNYTDQDSLAWYPDMARSPVLLDLLQAKGQFISIESGNQIWNGCLEGNGRSMAFVTSRHEPVSEHDWGEPQEIGCRTKLEIIRTGERPEPSAESEGSKIWPFSYMTTWHADNLLGMMSTYAEFIDDRYLTDFARWTVASDSSSWMESEDRHGLFRDPNLDKGQYNERAGSRFPISRSVSDRNTGVTTSWQVFPADNVHPSLGLQFSRVEITTPDAGAQPISLGARGEVLAAISLSESIICIACDWGLSLYNFRVQRQISSWRDPSADTFGHSKTYRTVALAPDGQRIFYLQADGTISVLAFDRTGNLSPLARVVGQTSGDPVIISRDNFYVASSRSVQGVHFSDGLQTYPFEQFDLRLNRPDVVLEWLGAPDEAVDIAKQLREKRLKRMGVTEDMLKPDFHVPELEIVGDVPATTDADEISLSIKASDSKYPVERLKVFVNNVPVNGRDGESLRDQNAQSLERTIPIKLAAGRNKIQVSVLNNAGAESLYANAEVNCTAERPKPTLYTVAMGVSEYSNPDWNLKYAAKDARDVLARLKDKAGDSYGQVKELLLTDKEVTKESIAKIKDFLSSATIDDTVLMFVAGHGLLDSNYDYYFGTTDIDFNNPSDKGIAFEEFDDLLAELPALKKSLLIDTCHAGELDDEEKTLLASAGGVSAALPTANGVAVRSIGTRGMNVKAVEGARGASEWYDRLQGLFVDLRRGSGSTILSSSAGAEYALESSEQQNGLFTYAVLEALDGKKEADTDKDGSIEMSELGEYVKKRVSELTNNKQTPNTRRVNLEGDFVLGKTR